MPFEYPRHPNTHHTNPLRDERGTNPFADDEPDESPPENPYAASAQASGGSYRPREYVTTLASRGSLVFWLGAIGVSKSALGALGVLLLLLLPAATASTWIYLCAGMLPLGLALSFSAWWLGSRDLRAIEAGAMEGSSRGKTRQGWTMGVIGSLIAVVPVVYAFALVVKRIADTI
jgi:hypothetical protein